MIRCLCLCALLPVVAAMGAPKKVHASRPLEGTWRLEGAGELIPPARVKVALQGQKALPNATARLLLKASEDWTAYNRIAFDVRTEVLGIPVLTLMVGIRNEGSKPPPAPVHVREAVHNVTPEPGEWTRVFWEIPHVSRDKVTGVDFRPWVNKRLPDPWDRVEYEIRNVELQRVDADTYEGWAVAPGRFAFSHSGYRPASLKQAIASGLRARTFHLVRDGATVWSGPVRQVKTRLGEYQLLDFTAFRTPGRYAIRADNVQSQPFIIGANVWESSLEKTLDFFRAERCGPECHRDWLAMLGDKRIVMNGGWHDAGDLSQGLINTGEAVYAMFRLSMAMPRDHRLRARVLDEALWGLQWLNKVRFPGGYRIGFASMNVWTNGIIGDEDDRPRAALNNPNVNYIAAAAGAAAYQALKDTHPQLAHRTLAIAEDDWKHAIGGVESAETQSTPAFAATEMELASIGATASAELYRATRKPEYAAKARALMATVYASQQRTPVGSTFPLAGFFYTGPDRKTLFHQFHRGNDQAPMLAAKLMYDTFPDDPERPKWRSIAELYTAYQKRAAESTAPFRVLPAYVYREDEWQTITDGDRYGSDRESFRRQVLAGMPMGDGWRLRAFPVWFTRRGNFGPLLSHTVGLAAASALVRDAEGLALAERQLEWVIGMNPFAQSTMWGEGYDVAPQYSVSLGDLVGSLPVGFMTRGDADAPYWPATNSYVYKEVWVHSSARWLSALEHLLANRR